MPNEPAARLAAQREMFETFFSPEGLARAGYWMYVANDSGDETLEVCPRMVCRRLDGKLFSKSDGIARSLFPPRHPGCRCSAKEYRDDDVRRYRLDVTAGSSVARRPSGTARKR